MLLCFGERGLCSAEFVACGLRPYFRSGQEINVSEMMLSGDIGDSGLVCSVVENSRIVAINTRRKWLKSADSDGLLREKRSVRCGVNLRLHFIKLKWVDAVFHGIL